eukprot:3241094-Amphidinium_carterae.1
MRSAATLSEATPTVKRRTDIQGSPAGYVPRNQQQAYPRRTQLAEATVKFEHIASLTLPQLVEHLEDYGFLRAPK